MRLYRARTLGSRPSRLPAHQGNEPHVRVRGRWFTSSRDAAVAYGEANLVAGRWELISIEIDDRIVDSFRVATTPRTRCGLSPVDHADDPETEYVVPTFFASDFTLAGVTSKPIASPRAIPARDMVAKPVAANDDLPRAA